MSLFLTQNKYSIKNSIYAILLFVLGVLIFSLSSCSKIATTENNLANQEATNQRELDALGHHDPVITGEDKICPDCQGTINLISKIDEDDKIEWYRKPYYPDGQNFSVIEGVFASQLTLVANTDLPCWIKAKITNKKGKVSWSNTMFMDSYAFSNPEVQISGNIFVDVNGDLFFKEGESVTLTAGLPYDLINTWWYNGNVLSQDVPSITVFDAGTYSFKGFPVLCPTLEMDLIEVTLNYATPDLLPSLLARESVTIRPTKKEPIK
ncbi:MAG: hypothetical protein QM528_08155 [Phycisphaerales bacterium]|nr:hypothetical protein [Phycisphaerales bacterium]